MMKNSILFAAGSALEFFGQSEIMSKFIKFIYRINVRYKILL